MSLQRFQLDCEDLPRLDVRPGDRGQGNAPDQFFLKGPIPLDWLCQAAGLPGKTLHVGILLWFLARLKKKRELTIGEQWLQRFGIKRHAAYRALVQLENSGLIHVKRRRGAKPKVRIVNASSSAFASKSGKEQ